MTQRRKINEPTEAAELREAFEKWAAEHGLVFIDSDSEGRPSRRTFYPAHTVQSVSAPIPVVQEDEIAEEAAA